MASAKNEKKARILIAEDDPMASNLLQNMLDLIGFDTDVAQTGAEAVKMWEQGEYDLITMDVQMPRMDGLTATRIIREKEKATGGHIPIVAMSAHTFSEDEEKGYAAGMDAYLTKPLDLEHGLATIKALIEC
ncbi:response receiver [Geotalea daltonii FRC-32]|uniref:Response receiver n=1 Tax=Geotalea daltonii (strain DSM 22248 / JCM 15807 / FRC-32) TaxID=316067 RepID=B9M6B9_GEODF|nr:response regulator [Geotalea daltonii]ACM21907.1 response receiver [Geotalea daltonii FRC-32]